MPARAYSSSTPTSPDSNAYLSGDRGLAPSVTKSAFPSSRDRCRRPVRSGAGHVNVIPIGRLKRLALHCLQGDLLSQKYITHRKIALRRKAQMRHYIAGSIQLVNIHHLGAPDTISGPQGANPRLQTRSECPIVALVPSLARNEEAETPFLRLPHGRSAQARIGKSARG
jgi:hypothetical protein